MRPLEVQLPDELDQRKFQVPKGDREREVAPLRYYRRVFYGSFSCRPRRLQEVHAALMF